MPSGFARVLSICKRKKVEKGWISELTIHSWQLTIFEVENWKTILVLPNFRIRQHHETGVCNSHCRKATKCYANNDVFLSGGNYKFPTLIFSQITNSAERYGVIKNNLWWIYSFGKYKIAARYRQGIWKVYGRYMKAICSLYVGYMLAICWLYQKYIKGRWWVGRKFFIQWQMQITNRTLLRNDAESVTSQ